MTFQREGRDPLLDEISSPGNIKRLFASIQEKIRKGLGISVTTNRPPSAPMPDTEQTHINALIERYQSLVFDDNKVGKLKEKPIHLDCDPQFRPVQPRYAKVPIHYQKLVSDLLAFLRSEGAIRDVDPSKSYDCVMNVVITDIKLSEKANAINGFSSNLSAQYAHQ